MLNTNTDILYDVSRVAKFIETERRMRVLVTRSWGRGEKGIGNGYIVSVLQYAKIRKVYFHISVNILKTANLCTLVKIVYFFTVI